MLGLDQKVAGSTLPVRHISSSAPGLADPDLRSSLQCHESVKFDIAL